MRLDQDAVERLILHTCHYLVYMLLLSVSDVIGVLFPKNLLALYVAFFKVKMASLK